MDKQLNDHPKLKFMHEVISSAVVKLKLKRYSHYMPEDVLTVVSQVRTHGHLNITRNFGPHGHLPGI